MAASTTDLEIAQRACVMVGISPIPAFVPTPPTAEAQFVNEIFESTVQAELEQYPWRFAMKQTTLSLDAAAPTSRWASKYELPTDCLMPRTVLVASYPIEYDRYENFIFADTSSTDTLVLEYTFRPIVARWSSGFQMGLIERLAGHIAIGVQERDRKSQELNSQADVTLLKARTADAQGQTSRGFVMDQFTGNRVGGNRRLVTRSNTT